VLQFDISLEASPGPLYEESALLSSAVAVEESLSVGELLVVAEFEEMFGIVKFVEVGAVQFGLAAVACPGPVPEASELASGEVASEELLSEGEFKVAAEMLESFELEKFVSERAPVAEVADVVVEVESGCEVVRADVAVVDGVAEVVRAGVAEVAEGAGVEGWQSSCCRMWEVLGSTTVPYGDLEASEALGLLQQPRRHPFVCKGLERRSGAEVRACLDAALHVLEIVKQKMCVYIKWSSFDRAERRTSLRVVLGFARTSARRLHDDANQWEAACLTAVAAAQPVAVKSGVVGPKKRKIKGVSQR